MTFLFNPKITYEHISIIELDELLQNQNGIDKTKIDKPIRGFEFLSKDAAKVQIIYETYEYQDEKNLKKFEIQEEKYDEDYKYDINIVAKHDKTLAGILSMKWCKSKLGDNRIWNYYTLFMDIHKTYQHKGIATNILQYLKKLPQTQGKVLRFGGFTAVGQNYIKPKLKEIFTDSDCYVLPKGNKDIYEVPTQPGCYII